MVMKLLTEDLIGLGEMPLKEQTLQEIHRRVSSYAIKLDPISSGSLGDTSVIFIVNVSKRLIGIQLNDIYTQNDIGL